MKAEEIIKNTFKPEEIMIGNWLYDAERGFYVQIQGISMEMQEYYCLIPEADNDTWGYDFEGDDELSPIPITPEILEKAGFKQSVGWYIGIVDRFGKWNSLELAYNNDNSTIQYYVYFRQCDSPNKNDVKGFVQLRHDLKYVHELQNLFYLLTSSPLNLTL